MLGHVDPNLAMAADSVFHKSDSDSVQTTPWTLQQMQPSHPPTQSHQGPRTRRPISPPPLTRDGSIASILDATSSVRQSPLRRAHESIPMRDFSAGDPMALSINTRLQTPQASTTPPSATRQFTTKRTPVASTPYRTDWDTKQFENALLEFSTEIGRDAARLTAHSIHSAWKQQAPQHRFVSKRNWFDGVFRRPVTNKAADTMMLRTKQVEYGRQKKNANKGEKRENFKAVCVETKQEPVPQYRFHHVEIVKNMLSPNTRLPFVPHLRDLEDFEEQKYRRWLTELEKLDRKSGFVPLNRPQKVAQTIQKERASTLLLYLDRWLSRLSIVNCTRATLIRHMASNADNVTPQQKTSILSSYQDNADPFVSASAIRMFTEAFDRVFKGRDKKHGVSLKEVLLLDKTVEPIVDSKKWMKDTPTQNKVTEQQSVESFLETYALLGCLICTGSTCEHGEYGVDNERKRFSVELVGGLSAFLGKQAQKEGQKPSRPCGDQCYLHGSRVFRAQPWSEVETMVLKSHYMTLWNTSIPVQCTAAMTTGRQCWDVQRQLIKMHLQPPTVEAEFPPQKAKTLPWFDRHKKVLLADWKDHIMTHEHQQKDRFDPCNHDGPCTPRNCDCVKNGLLCDRFCRCTAEHCSYKFTGCGCHSQGKICTTKQKDRPCICLQLNRECDPSLCGSCGSLERTDPSHADDEALHATGCQNCSLQRGKFRSVVLGESTIPDAGYGLFAAEDIPQDEFIIEYVGELISQDEGVRREARRGNPLSNDPIPSYLFTLLEAEGIWVDAANYGNLSRYINHQNDNCNVTPQILYVNGEYRIKFSSSRDIKTGEELCFNYGKEFPNLTKKVLKEGEEQEQEEQEKAQKKRRKNGGDNDGQGGARQKKSTGRKAGRKPGRPPGRPAANRTRGKLSTREASDSDDDGDSDDTADEDSPAVEPSRKRKQRDGEASDGLEFVMDSQDDAPAISSKDRQSASKRHKKAPARSRGASATVAEADAPKRKGRKPRWPLEQDVEADTPNPPAKQDEVHTKTHATPNSTRSATKNRGLAMDSPTKGKGPSGPLHTEGQPQAIDDDKESSPLSMVESMPDPNEERIASSPPVPGSRELRERRNLHIDMIASDNDFNDDDDDDAVVSRHRTRRKPVRYHE